MKRMQIYLPYSQFKALKEKAYEWNSSLSSVVRTLVEKELKREESKVNSGKWLLSLAKEAKVLKIKGPKDLSSKLDRYLYSEV